MPTLMNARSRQGAVAGSRAIAYHANTNPALRTVTSVSKKSHSLIVSGKEFSPQRLASPNATGPLHRPKISAGTANDRSIGMGRAYPSGTLIRLLCFAPRFHDQIFPRHCVHQMHIVDNRQCAEVPFKFAPMHDNPPNGWALVVNDVWTALLDRQPRSSSRREP